MKTRWVSQMVTIFAFQTIALACPFECKCGLEADGRRYIYCLQGQMYAIPIDQMNRDAEIIVIAPKDTLPNMLTIGPIFTQPQPFSRLEELHIVNSFVPSIGQYSFWGLPEMRILNLTHNNISHINADNFRGLLNLTKLHLDFNIVELMPSETFRYLTELRILTLTNNRISDLAPRVFRMLAKLRELDLSDNPLTELNPEAFKDVQDLRVLKCRSCGLRRVNTQIYHLAAYIEYLDLGDNSFKFLMSDEFISLKKLKVLKLDGNQLSVAVDDLFGHQFNLQFLTLSRNRLALLTPRVFTNVTRLKSLDISYNKLDRFHLQTFGPLLDSLRHLNLSGNNLPLNEIAIVLQMFPEIHGLGMSNLSISKLPPNFFSYNKHLTHLDLSWNKFELFPLDSLSKVKFLQNLGLAKNKFRSLDEPALIRLQTIAHIDLSENPWNCERCDIGLMLSFMEKSSLNSTIKKLVCYTPSKLKGIIFNHLTNHDISWCSSRFGSGFFVDEGRLSIFAGVLLVIFLISSAITAGICYNKRRTAEYYTNEEKRRSAAEKLENQLMYYCETDEKGSRRYPTVVLPEKTDHFMDGGSVATIHAPYQIINKGS